MHLGLTKSRDDKLLQDLLDKKLRVIVIFEDDYLNHIARIAYKDTQQDNYTYRIGEYNIYKGEEWGFCDFCKRHDCYFIVPNEIIEGGISEIPNDLGEAAESHAKTKYGLTRLLGAEMKEVEDDFIAGAKWQKEQNETELSEKIAAAYQLGLADKEKQMMKNAKDGWVDEEAVIILSDGTRIDLQPDYNKKPAFEFEYAQDVRVIVLPKKDEK